MPIDTVNNNVNVNFSFSIPNLDKDNLIDLGQDVDPKGLGRMLILALRKPRSHHAHVAYPTQVASGYQL